MTRSSIVHTVVRFLIIIFIIGLTPSVAVAVPSKQGDNLQTQADILRKEGNNLFYQSNYQAALPKFKEALRLYENIGNQRGQAIVLNDLGLVYNFLGKYDQALRYYELALDVTEGSMDLRDISNRGGTYGNMGSVYRKLGQYKKSLYFYQKALVIHQQIGDKGPEAITLGGMGHVYEALGQHQKALDYYHQSVVIFQNDTNDPRGEANRLKNLAGHYKYLGQFELALEYYQRALIIHQEANNIAMSAEVQIEIGEVYEILRQYDLALESYEQTLFWNQEADNRVAEGETLTMIGRVQHVLGQYHQALNYYQQALAIHRITDNKVMEETTLIAIGRAYQALNQNEKALDSYQLALTINEESGDLSKKWGILATMGSFYESLGDIEQAIVFDKKGVEVIESVHNEIKVDELKASFIAAQMSVYERLINLLWKTGRYEESFNYVERARARVFLDQLARGAIDFRKGASATLLQQEQSLRHEIAALRNQLFILRNQPGSEQNHNTIATVRTQLTDFEADYTDLLTQLKLQSPEIASLVSIDVNSLAETQNLLDKNITLIEYFVTDEQTLAFIITYNLFKVVAIDVGREELGSTITIFRDFASLDNAHPTALQKLHQLIIEPLKPYLNTPVIGVIPHSVLHYLPFSALTDGRHYLSDDFILFSLPSASMMSSIQEQQKPGPSNVLALGNPTTGEPGLSVLNFAEREVNIIADIYGTQALVGNAATESEFWSKASEAGVVHLAAHGTFNINNPLFSTIYLASDDTNDGRLEVHELYGLDLTSTTNLVVLSACKTVIGELSAGDEIVGLNRAFLYAGTPTVIASLWNVDDEATSLLMERFYTHLQEGLGKAEALRQAQIEVREEYPNPYYWSGFVLSGDPGFGPGSAGAGEQGEAKSSDDAPAAVESEVTAETEAASKAAPVEVEDETTAPVEAGRGQSSGGCFSLLLIVGALGSVGVVVRRRNG